MYSPPELAGMEAGLIALWQKCPHLGCRVPSCVSPSGSSAAATARSTTGWARRRAAPPPGMDRFAMEVSGDQFVVDTGTVINGPPIGTNTTGQEAEGPHCVSGGGR